MVMEEIQGIPVANIDTLKAAGINLKLLAERGVEIFLTQVFKHCFFHADMHPGNIFVSTLNPDSPQFIAVDFGIVGTLNRMDQRYLAENLMAFLRRDYRRVAELHIKSGWVGQSTRIEELESAIRVVCEPIFDRPIKEISMGQLLIRLLSIAKRFDMEVQPQLLLLQKTLIHVEGLGRQIYPELDLWQTAQPYLERWLKAQIGPRAFIKNFRENAPFWLERLPELPDLLYDALKDKQSRTALFEKQLQDLPTKQKPSTTASFLFGNTVTLSILGIGFFVINPSLDILIAHPLWVTTWMGVTLISAISAYCLK
jgi:ubiquinone biosynthesis protein